MKNIYFDTIQPIEKMYASIHDTLQMFLINEKVRDVTPIQARIVFAIGEESTTVPHLSKSLFSGKQLSHLISSLSNNGYVTKGDTESDKRCVEVSLSKKGLDLLYKLSTMFHEKNTSISTTPVAVEKALEVIESIHSKPY